MKNEKKKMFQISMICYNLLPFYFRYASLYRKCEHENLLEFVTYSIEALIWCHLQ